MGGIQFSEITKKILNEYYFNSSQSYTQIAENLGITRQTVSNHINKLKARKIFEEVKVLNPNLTGYRVFFTEIKTNPAELDIIPGLLEIKEIKSLDGIIGNTSLMAKFMVKPNEKINDVLQHIDEVLSKSEFQYYKMIDILTVFKSFGKILTENTQKEYNTIAFDPDFIKQTDYPFKWYLQLRPKKSTEYSQIAFEYLVHEKKIIDLYRTGQEFGLMAVVRTKSVDQYQNFLQDIYQSKHFQDSFTIFVLDERMPSTFKPYNI